MRFKEFLQEIAYEKLGEWELHALASMDITLPDGNPAKLKVVLETKKDHPYALGIDLTGPEKNPNGSIGLFHGDGIYEIFEIKEAENFTVPTEEKCLAALNRVAQAVDRVRISKVFQAFGDTASHEVKQMIYGNIFKTMFDGDEDDENELNKRLGK